MLFKIFVGLMVMVQTPVWAKSLESMEYESDYIFPNEAPQYPIQGYKSMADFLKAKGTHHRVALERAIRDLIGIRHDNGSLEYSTIPNYGDFFEMVLENLRGNHWKPSPLIFKYLNLNERFELARLAVKESLLVSRLSRNWPLREDIFNFINALPDYRLTSDHHHVLARTIGDLVTYLDHGHAHWENFNLLPSQLKSLSNKYPKLAEKIAENMEWRRQQNERIAKTCMSLFL